MGGLLQNLWGPQSDFQPPPPSLAELTLRAGGSLLPAPGQLRVANTGAGRFLGGVARVGGTLGGLIGEEMAKRRTDPITRQMDIATQALEASRAVQRPVPAGGYSLAVPADPLAAQFPAPPSPYTPPEPSVQLQGETPKPFTSFEEKWAAATPEQQKKMTAGLIFGKVPLELLAPEAEKPVAVGRGGLYFPRSGAFIPGTTPQPDKFRTLLDAVAQSPEYGYESYDSAPPEKRQEIARKAEILSTQPPNPLDEKLKRQRIDLMTQLEAIRKRKEEGKLTPKEAKAAIDRYLSMKDRGIIDEDMAAFVDSQIQELLPFARQANPAGAAPVLPEEEITFDPKKNKGKPIVNLQTGERKKSDGTKWIPVR